MGYQKIFFKCYIRRIWDTYTNNEDKEVALHAQFHVDPSLLIVDWELSFSESLVDLYADFGGKTERSSRLIGQVGQLVHV